MFRILAFRVGSPKLTPKAVPPSLTSIINPTYPPHLFKTHLNCISPMISIIVILSIIRIIYIISIICTPQAQEDPLGPTGPSLEDLPIIFRSSYDLTITLGGATHQFNSGQDAPPWSILGPLFPLRVHG